MKQWALWAEQQAQSLVVARRLNLHKAPGGEYQAQCSLCKDSSFGCARIKTYQRDPHAFCICDASTLPLWSQASLAHHDDHFHAKGVLPRRANAQQGKQNSLIS